MTVRSRRRPPARWSLRARVTAVATAVVGCLLALGLVVFYLAVRWTVYEDLRDRGDRAAADLAALVRTTDPHGPRALPVEDADFSLLQVVDDSGRVIASSAHLAGHKAMGAEPPGGKDPTNTDTVALPGIADRAYVVSVRVQTRGGWRTAYAGASMDDVREAKGAFVASLAVAVLLALGVVAWVVWRSVGWALRPVRVMSGELAAITGGRPSACRVTVPGGHDEVTGLAESVNVTLGRLEGVVESQRAFVADISHELRSPLTGLRAQLEVALQQPDDEDWPSVARAALDDADRLQGLVADLLLIAKLEAGVRAHREPVDLGATVGAEVARRPRRVPVETVAEDGLMVSATPSHLERLLTNLLDNAARHAATFVRVTVAAEGDDAVLEVVDDGAGIAPEDRELVFQRFQRLAESRRRDNGGSGLGLPISRDIAVAHGGSLEVADTDAGARLVLRLPLAAGYDDHA
ncbi:sensor histidine kinase [Spirillospora sp. CA-294931]|uniref:sensor histidine kinase n=1 Tax=Spirillospora sp. CA-294931 TaxID=3240042 RepID=UPI003D9326C8